MSDYFIYFKAPKYSVFELPVNPQEVSISYPGNPTNYDVEGIGEIVVPRLPKLATVTFESFFPREKIFQPMTSVESWYKPEWYVTFFRNMQKSGTPFELTIMRGYDSYGDMTFDESGSIEINETMYFDTIFEKAVILDFTITDKGGEPGDIYYNMSISEYRDASPQNLSEIANETYNDDGSVDTQERVIVPNRPPQEGEITVDTAVSINGPSFEDPEEEENKRKMDDRKQVISQVERRVSRILPPSVANTMHSIYVAGLGWLNKKDCSLVDSKSNIYGIKRLIVDNV